MRWRWIDYSKGLAMVVSPKCKVSPRMKVLPLEIAILLMLVDEGRSAKRLKTYLCKFCALLSIADWVSSKRKLPRPLLRHDSEGAIMIARFSPVYHLFPPTNIMGGGRIEEN